METADGERGGEVEEQEDGTAIGGGDGR